MNKKVWVDTLLEQIRELNATIVNTLLDIREIDGQKLKSEISTLQSTFEKYLQLYQWMGFLSVPRAQHCHVKYLSSSPEYVYRTTPSEVDGFVRFSFFLDKLINERS